MRPTLRLRADIPADLLHAAAILKSGGLVAFPTETVYGLGANALSSSAVERIFTAKQRPAWDPLIVHVAEAAEVATVAALTDLSLQTHVDRIAAAYWPGPLTLLLPRRSTVPDAVTAGRPRVGVRVPAHPVAQELLRLAGVPLAAPSANRFGHISPTTAQHVLDDLDGRIDAVLDGGACTVGVESTVLDPSTRPMTLYRAGAIGAPEIALLTGIPVHTYEPPAGDDALQREALPSPGVGIRHYAPRVPVLLAGSTPDTLFQLTEVQLQAGSTVGVLQPEGWKLPVSDRLRPVAWGVWNRPEQLAAQLFAGLRALEDLEVSVIVCPLPEPGGLRDALRDRLLKAARPH